MSYRLAAARTRRDVVGLSSSFIRSACEEGKVVDLVVPTHKWAQQRKVQLLDEGLAGVRVATYGQWLEGLWDLFGDGRRVAGSAQRRALARSVLSGHMASEPSARLLTEYCAFLEEACVWDGRRRCETSEAEMPLLDSVESYLNRLEELSLVEPAQAEELLMRQECGPLFVVVEEPDPACVHSERFLRGLGCSSEVYVVARSLDGVACAGHDAGELGELSHILYTGKGGVEATGAVVAGEAHGAHIEGELVAELIAKLKANIVPVAGVDAGAPFSIAAVFANAADSYPRVQDALARAGIPFSCTFTLPFQQTQYGAAFLELLDARACRDEPASYEALAGFSASPYSGIDPRDARAAHARWRARAHSLAEAREKDVREGFAQGMADASAVKERLLPLAELLDMDLRDAALAMFEHACHSKGSACEGLHDDAHAADALLDYLDACLEIEVPGNAADIATLPVVVERSFGAGEEAVELIGARDLDLGDYDGVILANLDADRHPMAQRPGTFGRLLGAVGAAPRDIRAMRERCLLLDCLEAAHGGFGFYRLIYDVLGEESCQSALWDELVTAYTPQGADTFELQLSAVFGDVGAYAGLSEAEVFGRVSPGGTGSRSQSAEVGRGVLDASSMTLRHLTQYPSGDAIPFSPTALEDYYRCPYRWFASRRVGYNSLDNEFSASAQGNLAHGFLDAFYRALRGKGYERVDHRNLEEALVLGDQLFDELVERGKEKPKTGLFVRSESDKLACEQVKTQVFDLLRRDADFLPGFVPTYFELELGRGTGAVLEYAGVPVRGKVDRIDVDAHGRAVIVDYKLSGLSSGYGLTADAGLPQRIQTDIYALLVQRHFKRLGEDIEVVGSVYRSYSTNMLRGVYTHAIDWGPVEHVRSGNDALPNDNHPVSYKEYLDDVEREVERSLAQLGLGRIAPDPLAPGTCEYCKALLFCPRKEA